MILFELFLRTLGTIIFFLPGVLLSYVIFKKTSFIERAAYSIIFSSIIATLLGFILILTKVLFSSYIIISMIFLNIILIFILLLMKKRYSFSTGKINKTFFIIIFFTLIGFCWRLYFRLKANEWGDGITSHLDHLISDKIREVGSYLITIPNLGFYIGMVKDHANFFGKTGVSAIYEILSFHHNLISIFLSVFLLVVFTYIVIKCYTKNEKLALFGALVISFGPVEIWQNTFTFFGGELTYVAVISLFILYKRRKLEYSWFVLLLAISLMFCYYTIAVAMIILSAGFMISLAIKNFEYKKISSSIIRIFTDKVFLSYLMIIIIILSFIFVFSIERVSTYTTDNIQAVASKAGDLVSDNTSVTNLTTPKTIMPYKNDTRFLGIPIISWQDIYLMFLGVTFIIHLLFRKINEDDKDILYSFIPVLLLAIAFLSVNMPERLFSYFAFFCLLSVKISKRFFTIFAIFSMIFIIVTGFVVASDRVRFFSNSNGEIDAAKWVKNNLNGTILGDERFISLVIQQNYFDVDGFKDDSVYLYPVFYENDSNNTIAAFSKLKVIYFATTKRMREDYILMLNFPQEHMTNAQMYEDSFKKVYDNNDVRIYKIK